MNSVYYEINIEINLIIKLKKSKYFKRKLKFIK